MNGMDNLVDKYIDDIVVRSAGYEPLGFPREIAFVLFELPYRMINEFLDMEGNKNLDISDMERFWYETSFRERLTVCRYDGQEDLYEVLEFLDDDVIIEFYEYSPYEYLGVKVSESVALEEF